MCVRVRHDHLQRLVARDERQLVGDVNVDHVDREVGRVRASRILRGRRPRRRADALVQEHMAVGPVDRGRQVKPFRERPEEGLQRGSVGQQQQLRDGGGGGPMGYWASHG